MDLRHLRYFVAVAEELHFTRAAARLGIQQPPLSHQIRQLEDELGTKLLRRLTRGIELTESGSLLLEEARRILNQVERTKADIQSLARGTTGHIRVGFACATYFQPLVLHIIRTFRERYPGVTLTPEQSVTPRLVTGLHGNEVDVAFVWSPLDDSTGLGLYVLIEEPLVAVLPSEHPLANDSSVELASLASDTFILLQRIASPGFHDAIVTICQRAGFILKLGQETPDIPSAALMVAAGFGVSIVPQSVSQIQADGLAYLKIKGEAPLAPIALAYRREGQSQAVHNFIALSNRLSRIWAGTGTSDCRD
jgi:DNA-binding transcriptional LysR family regulator